MKKIILFFILLLSLHFYLASKTVVYGENLSLLEQKIDELKDNNQQIELEIATSSSLSVIAQGIEEESVLPEEASINDDSVVALRR